MVAGDRRGRATIRHSGEPRLVATGLGESALSVGRAGARKVRTRKTRVD